MEPTLSDQTDKLWCLVDNIVTDSGVGYSQSWGDALISWLNAHYILPEGYNKYHIDGPGEWRESYLNVDNMTFI